MVVTIIDSDTKNESPTGTERQRVRQQTARFHALKACSSFSRCRLAIFRQERTSDDERSLSTNEFRNAVLNTEVTQEPRQR